jgi:hypothetical protein
MTGVAQKAAVLLQCPSRQRWARSGHHHSAHASSGPDGAKVSSKIRPGEQLAVGISKLSCNKTIVVSFERLDRHPPPAFRHRLFVSIVEDFEREIVTARIERDRRSKTDKMGSSGNRVGDFGGS